MRKLTICLCFLLLSVTFGGCLAVDSESHSVQQAEDIAFAKLQPIESLDILDETGEKIVYFGRATCYECQKLEPVLFSALQNDAVESIYYFNTDYWREDPEFESVLEQYAVSGVPYFASLKDGTLNHGLSFDELLEAGDTQTQVAVLVTFFSKNNIGEVRV